MRFLANENLPRATIQRLRDAGHDVFAVIDRMPGATDSEILQRAHDERRIILTFDRDYGELIFQRRLPAPVGIIYLRFIPRTAVEPAGYILRLLEMEHLNLKGRFTVATRERLRQRPLPDDLE